MKRFSILLVILCVSTFAVAQKADAAFVLGGSFVSDTNGTVLTIPATVHTDHHIFLEGALGIRLLNAQLVSLHAELPVAGIPSQALTIKGVAGTLDHLGTTFITPGLRLKFAPVAPISPWVSVGGGWAHYSLNTAGTTENKGALQFGGGLDFKTNLPVLGFRAEVRDFLTGVPTFNSGFLTETGLHHHNILAGGGIVLRF
ncbi:MAG TPA: hypothetical protein VNB54_11535 [Alphaproteobacteria bacterium]|nr:hypothetical protein [Alphaproteobacteria bacterium]